MTQRQQSDAMIRSAIVLKGAKIDANRYPFKVGLHDDPVLRDARLAAPSESAPAPNPPSRPFDDLDTHPGPRSPLVVLKACL